MNTSIMQAYTDYLVTINKMVYDTHMELVKTTQEFAAEAAKINPYKDMYGFMDLTTTKKK